MKLSFEWGEEKAKANLKKHRVGFDEATTVLNDSFSITIPLKTPNPHRPHCAHNHGVLFKRW